MKKEKHNLRRDFIKKASLGSVSFALGMSAKSYGNILGANERIQTGIMGVNGRGRSLARNFARQQGVEVTYICDVDENAMVKAISAVNEIQKKKPKGVKDFRAILEDKSLDALVIAAPDHWHAPASILACKAGKHVYVEKPCSHNPHEGELLIDAARKYNRIVQMGSQRRSWPKLIEGVQEIKDGIIGRAYFAKGWYTNTRPSIGYGKSAEVPAWLDYELWQGPAPRREYQDNLIHYNWHWFWHWGTGEALNNGTHEIDLMRWGLDVDYPIRVTSVGGRYHYQDDWETPDTQVISFDFEGRKSMEWEGRSCTGRPIEGSGRGVVFYGENGSVVTTGDNGYSVYDNKNKLVKEVKDDNATDTLDTTGPGDKLDAYHISNFLECMRKGKRPNAEIETGHKSVLLCQLGNIAQRTGKTLNCDQRNGHIIGDKEAMALWARDYEPGWEPRV